MPVDNTLYDQMADTWWDEKGYLNALTVLNEGRFRYFHHVLEQRLLIRLPGLRVLDVGCGGGLLTEKFAQAGSRVSGIDPSFASVAVATSHATMTGLGISYIVARGEEIPFPDGSVDAVCCCDALEHVDDPDKVITEMARVLKRGGTCFYETVNRTLLSRLIAVELLQEWAGLIPRNTHDWTMFIKPQELHRWMARHGIENRETVGQMPRANLLRLLDTLRRRIRGEINWSETRERLDLHTSDNTSLSYMGYGVKV